MRIEICIAKEKMTKMPNGAVDALKEELTRRISKRYDDVEVIVKATSNDGLSVTRTADKDSAKTFVQETFFAYIVSGSSGHSISGAVDVSTRFSNTRYFF
ncbi:DinI-like family protein [Escherichia coli]|uniref:DinI-like family protein n=1 Tax=Escherichia coli TaxID=562 RepID=UPI002588443A|nr:DinI-like family protein [Escherichia coli]